MIHHWILDYLPLWDRTIFRFLQPLGKPQVVPRGNYFRFPIRLWNHTLNDFDIFVQPSAEYPFLQFPPEDSILPKRKPGQMYWICMDLFIGISNIENLSIFDASQKWMRILKKETNRYLGAKTNQFPVDVPLNQSILTDICIPVVPHKAVAEVSKIGNL